MGETRMKKSSALPDWNALAPMADSSLPLFETALLIAQDEYPDLRAEDYIALVDDYAQQLQRSLPEQHDIQEQCGDPNKTPALVGLRRGGEIGRWGNQPDDAV